MRWNYEKNLSLVSLAPFLHVLRVNWWVCVFLFGCQLVDNNGTRKLAIDGGFVWYKVAGPASSPAVFYIHGGPGSNSYVFEKSVGVLLEKQLRMVYLDQRGGGRSTVLDSDDPRLRMDYLVDDIEDIRRQLSTPKINLICHSFGGLICLKYVERYPENVGKLIMVDTTPQIESALAYQVHYLASIAQKTFPEKAKAMASLASSKEPVPSKLQQAYQLLGRLPVQRNLQFNSEQSQAAHEQLENESGVFGNSNISGRMLKDGYLSDHLAFMHKLPVPTLLFAGRHSHTIGAENIESAAQAWRVPIVWFENSGHMPYFEEPKKFVKHAIEFLLK